MVMDSGSVAECGLPNDLLKDKDGYFSGLVNELGPEMKASFVSIAQQRANFGTATATATATATIAPLN